MAVTITPLGIGGGLPRIVTDTSTNATSVNNINDGAATVYLLDIDNSANAAIEYFKAYDSATAPTVGTTVPDLILMLQLSVRRLYVFTTGVSFSTGLSYATVTTAGTAGTTNPGSAVTLTAIIG